MKVIVEIATKLNASVRFGPATSILRGRWTSSNAAHLSPSPSGPMREIARIDRIPGIWIVIDMNKRMASVVDPLAETEEGQEIYRQLRSIQNRFKGRIDQGGPLARTDYQDLSNDELKTWLYWTRRLVDNNMAVIIEGDLPTLDVIKSKMPGGVKLDFWATQPDPNQQLAFMVAAKPAENAKQ